MLAQALPQQDKAAGALVEGAWRSVLQCERLREKSTKYALRQAF